LNPFSRDPGDRQPGCARAGTADRAPAV